MSADLHNFRFRRFSVIRPNCAVAQSSSSSTSWLKPTKNKHHLIWFHIFFLTNICWFTKLPFPAGFCHLAQLCVGKQHQHKFALDWGAPPKSLREERKDRGSTIGQKGHSLLTRLITCHYFCMKPLKPNKAKPSTSLSVVRSHAIIFAWSH